MHSFFMRSFWVSTLISSLPILLLFLVVLDLERVTSINISPLLLSLFVLDLDIVTITNICLLIMLLCYKVRTQSD